MIPWWVSLWHSSYYLRTLVVGAAAALALGILWLLCKRAERRACVAHHQRVIAEAVERARRDKIMESLR